MIYFTKLKVRYENLKQNIFESKYYNKIKNRKRQTKVSSKTSHNRRQVQQTTSHEALTGFEITNQRNNFICYYNYFRKQQTVVKQFIVLLYKLKFR